MREAIQIMEDAMREHGRVFVELQSLNENMLYWLGRGIGGPLAGTAQPGEDNAAVARRELQGHVDELRQAASGPLAALFVAHDMLLDMWREIGQRERDAMGKATKEAAASP
jgi:hypothetical protein